jgi:hypothetical protein
MWPLSKFDTLASRRMLSAIKFQRDRWKSFAVSGSQGRSVMQGCLPTIVTMSSAASRPPVRNFPASFSHHVRVATVPKMVPILGGQSQSQHTGLIKRFLEPLLFTHAAAQPRVRILNRSKFEELSQDKDLIRAVVSDLDSGKRFSISCKYLVGCDGGRSTVRHIIGAQFTGDPVVQHVQSTYFRAPALKSLLPGEPAWM